MNPDVIVVPPSIAYQYIIHGSTGYLLIDTGLPNNYTHLINYFRQMKIPLEQLEFVVVTHSDGDHYGCLAKLQKINPGMISTSSPIESSAIIQGKSSRELQPNRFVKPFFNLIGHLFTSDPARIDRTVSIGEELPYLGGLEILDSSGHTPGHISLWSKSTRTLFCGDSIQIKGKHLFPSTGANTWDSKKAFSSFERQISLNPDRIYAGHGIWSRD